MILALTVPDLIADVDQVRVLEWHGQPGDGFDVGQLVVELETHKALVEVRAGQAGYLRTIIGHAGDWCEVGKPLALFSDLPDEALPGASDGAGELLATFDVT